MHHGRPRSYDGSRTAARNHLPARRLGLVLVIGGAFAVFRALSGSAHTLTGGATTVPSTVRTTPPRPAADTAAALRASAPVRMIYANTRYPGLRLITCGGPFDTATRRYLENIVVYSHLVG